MSSPSVTIRPEAPGDVEAINAVTTQAFEGEAEGKIVDGLREAGLFLPSGSLVAIASGKVAGHLLLSWVPLRRPDGGTDDRVAAALGPMAVAPELQRCGIGSKLVERSIEVAREAGARIVIVLGHPEFYPRFGFTPARPQGIECPFPLESDAPWMAFRLDEDDPAPGGTPEYPEAWNQA
ncbi:MAG: GNAT family N-acetyltransferase [Planctomycetota bacterium]|jgi:putative acetyltransferase